MAISVNNFSIIAKAVMNIGNDATLRDKLFWNLLKFHPKVFAELIGIALEDEEKSNLLLDAGINTIEAWIDRDLKNEVYSILKDGRKVDAIKHLRNATIGHVAGYSSISLKAAKDYVESSYMW